MLNTSFAPWPSYSEEEIAAVSDILRSNRVNYWTGNQCREFESEFAAWTDTHHAIALANGTLALDLALKAIAVGEGDEVIVTPRTFIASVSAVINAGATPVFADVNRDSGNIDADTILPKITKKTKAIIPVHLGGWPCEMEAITSLAADHDLRVIEDCAQAHGGAIDGKALGSFGDIGAWSFCQDKIMTTGGEGGMITTNNSALWSTMWSFKDHGKSWDAVYKEQHPPGFRWVHESIGTNWRMLEIQATIGRLQLLKMENWSSIRTENAMAIAKALSPFSSAVRAPMPEARFKHAYYRYYAYVDPAGLKEGWTRDRILAEFALLNIPVMQGSCSEVYLEKAFDNNDARPKSRLPIAKELGETSLMFLTHPTISKEQIAMMCSQIEKIFSAATR